MTTTEKINPIDAIYSLFSLNDEYSFESQISKIKMYKRIADKQYKISILKCKLYDELQLEKILNPKLNYQIAHHLDVNKLIHIEDSITNEDWSYYADGTITELKKLQAIGSRYEDLIKAIK